MEIKSVKLSKQARKDLKKIPAHIAYKLTLWAKTVEEIGVLETRKLKGYHDEPLQGLRKGQRSIRLNKAYRAIYTEYDHGKIELNYIKVEQVNKHEY
ncbi:type II toxin-antitoxin system mRNA interferase toxin, RelE/StbE family [Facilibium subflavum]|uniref:type II toxin-antitoxin system mRNA interferase toxin, RelE/StbE family n=1 Tax=Facilibium subflavum TaxID=2219058 RepID=UPI000E65B470|nr:type II toxin-antitoxin system mRNA interferase toxin, RelE/StbE family [Facilibium subflavum]